MIEVYVNAKRRIIEEKQLISVADGVVKNGSLEKGTKYPLS